MVNDSKVNRVASVDAHEPIYELAPSIDSAKAIGFTASARRFRVERVFIPDMEEVQIILITISRRCLSFSFGQLISLLKLQFTVLLRQ